MGQVISIIFGRLFGGKKRAESESPKPNHEDYSTLRSYYIDIIKEHDHNKEAAAAATPASFDPHHRVVTIFPQQRQQPQAVLDPLVDDDLRQPLIATNSIVASSTAESTTEAAFHRYHHVVPVYPQQQQQEEAVLDPSVEDFFYQPLIATNSTVHSSPAESTTAAAFHRHHHVVPIYPQQQQEEVVLDPSVEELFYQPLIATNSIDAGTTGVEGTEELTIKSIPEEAPSTKRKRKNKKKSPKNEEAIVKKIGPYVNMLAVDLKRKQQQAVLDPLVDDLRQPLIATNSIVASSPAESTTEAAFHRYHHVVPVYPQQQQQEEAVLDPSVEDFFYQPLIATNSTVASSPAESTTAAAFHRHHHVVPIYPQQQQEEAVLDPSVEELFYQPLKATNSTVAATTGVEGTEELTIKSIPEEAPSTRRKRKSKKKSPKNEEAIVKKIGPYVNTHKILLVGEGDFSFSASLATAFGIASNIIATSFNEKAFLTKNYKNSMANIQKLESRGALVIHDVDATKMAKHKSLKGMKFDRIIFNFPHTCNFGRTPSDISRNQELVLGFLKNGKKMIEKDGEIHVTHKTSRDYAKWNIAQLGATEDLNLIVASPFDPKVFPGYDTKYGHGGDKNFDCFPCKTYKFRLDC